MDNSIWICIRCSDIWCSCISLWSCLKEEWRWRSELVLWAHTAFIVRTHSLHRGNKKLALWAHRTCTMRTQSLYCAKQSTRPCCPLLKLMLIKKISIILTPCTSTQRKRTKTRKRTKKELPNPYIKLLNYRHPFVRFLLKTRSWSRSKSL